LAWNLTMRHGPPQRFLGPVSVGRITPDPEAGDPHDAETPAGSP
jgi:hypothetical protein